LDGGGGKYDRIPFILSRQGVAMGSPKGWVNSFSIVVAKGVCRDGVTRWRTPVADEDTRTYRALRYSP